MPQTTITHLPSVGSDHCPLLMEMIVREEDHIKYFKFLNCWTDQPKFIDNVKTCWERPIEGNNMWRFHQKLKRLSNTLSSWSRGEFGDIFIKFKEYEERVRAAEENLIHTHNEINRTNLHELNAEYIRFLKMEDSILKQKTQLHWFKEERMEKEYRERITLPRLLVPTSKISLQEWTRLSMKMPSVVFQNGQSRTQ
ncbi:hypothetical protein KY285_035830 [Solanum tuberosum]|nr:hypothetical protein KY285_035830 [Solanum tuberosum]